MNYSIKNKKCRVCGVDFVPYRTTQRCCSASHEREYSEKRKKQREEAGKTKEKSKRLIKLELARIAFNAYIRERDKKEKCICCGKPLGKDFQAGHYYSGAAHAAVLFDEDNVHAQRFECNNAKAGNNIEYGVMLEKKIGAMEFELLRARAYEVKKWSVEELDEIIKRYRSKLIELKNKD